MKLKNLTLPAICLTMLLAGCSGGSTPLKELADTYAEIAENLQKITAGTQAVMDAPREEQNALQEKSIENTKKLMSENDLLAEKAATLAEKLQGTEIKCEASPALGVKVASASFTTVNANKGGANVVITAETEGNLSGKPYFFLMNGKEILYKAPAGVSEGKVTVNFHISTKKGPEAARTIAKTEYVRLVTESEYASDAIDASAAPAAEVQTATEPEPAEQEAEEPEPAFQGTDEDNSVNEATTEGVKIEKGANLVAVLKAAKDVSYEYNADSGIWANIGNVSIVIDESQLNQKGIDFINGILSDIEPNLAFSPDYLKPDAKILKIEKN